MALDRFGPERRAAKDTAEDYAGVNLTSDSTAALSRAPQVNDTPTP